MQTKLKNFLIFGLIFAFLAISQHPLFASDTDIQIEVRLIKDSSGKNIISEDYEKIIYDPFPGDDKFKKELNVKRTPEFIITPDKVKKVILTKQYSLPIFSVSVILTPDTAKLLEKTTRNHIGERTAIFVNGKLTYYSRIWETISDGCMVALPNVDIGKAKKLAKQLSDTIEYEKGKRPPRR